MIASLLQNDFRYLCARIQKTSGWKLLCPSPVSSAIYSKWQSFPDFSPSEIESKKQLLIADAIKRVYTHVAAVFHNIWPRNTHIGPVHTSDFAGVKAFSCYQLGASRHEVDRKRSERSASPTHFDYCQISTLNIIYKN